MLYTIVNDTVIARPANKRSDRLKAESDNCLAIAIREGESETAALLIDEAMKLARRARELSGAA